MKNLAVISFTEKGGRLAGQIARALSVAGFVCEAWGMKKYAAACGVTPLEEGLREWAGRMFREADGILFIGAAGIAVRAIAPYVKDKREDPAIVVMDEKGMFVIPLLSGHLGGANELAGILSNLTGAVPVITTATDVNGRFAVDIFAKKNRLYIDSMRLAKEISADVLDEKKIGFHSDFPVASDIPRELCPVGENEVFEGTNGICVTLDEKKCPFKQTLHLIPGIVTAGVGCRRGTGADVIEKKVLEVLEENGLSIHCLESLASIDLKADEKGMIMFSEKYGIPFKTYTKEELEAVPGEFEESEFVRSVTGVGNVCERSALLGSGMGKLVNKKKSGDGVTVALAVKEWSVDFE